MVAAKEAQKYRFSTLHRVVGGETLAQDFGVVQRQRFSTLHRVVGGETVFFCEADAWSWWFQYSPSSRWG